MGTNASRNTEQQLTLYFIIISSCVPKQPLVMGHEDNYFRTNTIADFMSLADFLDQ